MSEKKGGGQPPSTTKPLTTPAWAREWFAGCYLIGLATLSHLSAEEKAAKAFEMADAMLAAGGKK